MRLSKEARKNSSTMIVLCILLGVVVEILHAIISRVTFLFFVKIIAGLISILIIFATIGILIMYLMDSKNVYTIQHVTSDIKSIIRGSVVVVGVIAIFPFIVVLIMAIVLFPFS